MKTNNENTSAHSRLLARQNEIRQNHLSRPVDYSGKRVVVCLEYPPNSDGGIQRTTTSLAAYLSENGANVSLVYPVKKRLEASPTKPIGKSSLVAVPTTGRNKNLDRLPSVYGKNALAEISLAKADSIVLSSPDMVGLSLLGFLNETTKKRTTVVWNSPIDIGMEDIGRTTLKEWIGLVLALPLYNLRTRMWANAGVNKLNAVFNSFTNLDSYNHLFPNEVQNKQIVIPPTTELCHPCSRSRYGAKAIREDLDGSFVVLTTGRTTSKKGVDKVLDLAEEVDEIGERISRKISYVITTDSKSPYSKDLRQRASQTNSKLRNGEIVLFDRPTDEDLCNLYTNSDLFLNPSGIEGFGLTTVEAASHGLAIAGINNRGSAELIPFFGDGGCIMEYNTRNGFSDKSINHFKDFILRISSLSFEERHRMNLRQQQIAMNNFAPEILNRELANFVLQQ